MSEARWARDQEPVDKLDLILAQTTKTNGRVDRLHEEVFGDARTHTPGLIADVSELKSIVYDARAVLRVAKWALPVFGVSSVGTLVKVWAG